MALVLPRSHAIRDKCFLPPTGRPASRRAGGALWAILATGVIIFFALDAAVMAYALELALGIPPSQGYR